MQLPTEAQWEYACRAGSTSKYYWEEPLNGDYLWYHGNIGDKKYAHKVGQKRPNAFGLYDMAGNVWEWCYDWYGENYYSSNSVQNPIGPASGKLRAHRGGSWYGLRNFGSAGRNGSLPSEGFIYLGFRPCIKVE